MSTGPELEASQCDMPPALSDSVRPVCGLGDVGRVEMRRMGRFALARQIRPATGHAGTEDSETRGRNSGNVNIQHISTTKCYILCRGIANFLGICLYGRLFIVIARQVAVRNLERPRFDSEREFPDFAKITNVSYCSGGSGLPLIRG